MSEQRKQIRVDQWAEVAADVEAGRCKAWFPCWGVRADIVYHISGLEFVYEAKGDRHATRLFAEDKLNLEWLVPPDIEAELQAMANDPDIQREYAAIRAEEYGGDNQRVGVASKWGKPSPIRPNDTDDTNELQTRIEALEAEKLEDYGDGHTAGIAEILNVMKHAYQNAPRGNRLAAMEQVLMDYGVDLDGAKEG